MFNITLTTPSSTIPNILGLLENIFGSCLFLITMTVISFVLKSYIFYSLACTKPKSIKLRVSWVLLMIVLVGVMVEDIAWFLRTLQYNIIPSFDYRLVRLVIRIAWLLSPLRYHAFCLFLEHSVNKSYSLSLRQKILLCITISCSIFFIPIMIIDFNCAWHRVSLITEIIAIRLIPIYSSLILTPICLWYTLNHMRTNILPRILAHQIKILIQVLIIPIIIMDFLQNFPFNFCITSISWATNSYTVVGISSILLTYMTYYCARKMVGLRFLNMTNHVQSTRDFNFIDNFKEVLEQLGKATTMQELTFITQDIFQRAFSVPSRAITLHTCTYQPSTNKTTQPFAASTIDTVLSTSDSQLANDIRQTKILIYDEIAFNNFYGQDEQSGALLKFLDNIGADIFIPICNRQKIIGCIIIERGARPQSLYGSVERDEMIVFSSYLGNIINLLQNRNLENVLASEKEMKEELFSKHQEVNQYKESMRSFLHNTKHSRIGIIFYKNRQFVFGNREAQDLININLNVHIGHPLAKSCRQVVADVEHYQATQTIIAHDGNGSKIVINGMPYLDRTHVILVIYYPEATDLIYKQIDQLKNPSEWDYLLYLETTKIGQLINQMIPGNGTHLLNFKIELLKTALSSKASLLDMPSEDLTPTVELLHHISLRSQLHTITLEHPQITPDITIKLFGINPLFAQQAEEPLLKKLDSTGTLFIQNIHFLNLETQDYLAEFIHYGFFRIYKSDQKILSSARIICSSNHQLDQLVHEGKISTDLFKELQKTTLVMPPLSTIDEGEIDELANGFVQQAMVDKTFEKILEFDKKDRKHIIDSRPTSLQELKKRVQSFLVQKSRANNISVDKTFDPGYQITDPDLVDIARLGKHALKDEKAMSILWNKFKNQNKIATFLGVNRSSVNRRCKDYKLL